MNVIRTAFAVAALGFGVACTTPAAQPGSAAVYQRIGTLTDCTQLQTEFDIADTNGEAARNRGNIDLAKISTSYMRATDQRMQDVGCY